MPIVQATNSQLRLPALYRRWFSITLTMPGTRQFKKQNENSCLLSQYHPDNSQRLCFLMMKLQRILWNSTGTSNLDARPQSLEKTALQMRKSCIPDVSHRSPHYRATTLPESSAPGVNGGQSRSSSLERRQGELEACSVHSKSKRPASGIQRFPRQAGTKAEEAGRSVCASAQSFLELNVPSTWRGSKQRCRSRLCLWSPGQPKPGQDSRTHSTSLLTSPSS